ncbi:MAG TPA: DMT family transporter [Candidatus Limnocylindrales bacterium]|nr:DMT family transporter [Candidatus Limnocylindrales bacterium]
MEYRKHAAAHLGSGLVVLSSLVYASYGVWIKLLGNFLGDFTQAVLRGVLVILLLLPVAIFRNKLSRIFWRRDAWLLIGLLISNALISVPLFYSIKIIGVGLGLAVAYAGIVLGAFFFGRIFNGEVYTKDKVASTILGIMGLWLIFTPSTKIFGLLALLAALISGLASGLNMVVNKKIKYSVLQTAILTWIGTVLANIPMIFILNESFPQINSDIHWIYLLLFALASFISSWLLISGLKLIEAGTAGILGLLEIVFGVVLGIIFFKEHLTAVVTLGMTCIIAAAAIPYVNQYNNRKEVKV